jgi:hypothetical protein
VQLRKWLAPFREFGVVAGLAYVAHRLLTRCSPHWGLIVYELMQQPVAAKPLLPPAHAGQVRWVELGRDAPQLAEMPPPAAVKQARFDQGAACIAVYYREKYVGYVWFAFGHYEEDEVRCTFELAEPTRSVFDFDVYVFPQHRVGRAFAALWHAANGYLLGRGVVRTCSRISRFNEASRRAHAQLGARVIGRALFLRLGRFEYTLAKVHAAWTHQGSLSSRPRLIL